MKEKNYKIITIILAAIGVIIAFLQFLSGAVDPKVYSFYVFFCGVIIILFLWKMVDGKK